MNRVDKIGIFGGTFDPIHLGHTGCAEAAANQLDLDKVIFVPAGVSNFKQDQNTAPRKDRLEMCRLAIECHENFDLDSFEIERYGISYTSDTVAYFRQLYPQAKLYFITGSDAALTFDKWHCYRTILEHATLVAVSRKGAPVEKKSAQHLHEICNNKVTFIEADVPDISSHEIREKLNSLASTSSPNINANTESLTSYLSNYLDSKVLNYIVDKSLYFTQ